MHSELIENLLNLLAQWQKFSLDNKRSSLDKQGLEIANNNALSVKSRQILAEENKKFKAAAPEERIKLVPSLLKSYQNEIDSLTQRSKFAESIFLDLYKQLFELNDPVSVLHAQCLYMKNSESMNDKIRDSALIIQKMEEKLNHYQNQEAKLSQLEDKAQYYEKNLALKIQEGLNEQRIKLMNEVETAKHTLIIREKEIEERLAESNDKIRMLKQQLYESQSLAFENNENSRSKGDDIGKNKAFETDYLLTEDVKQRVLFLESENQSLREKLKEGREGEDFTKNDKDGLVKNSIYEVLQNEYFQRGIEIEKLNDEILNNNTKLAQKDLLIANVQSACENITIEMEKKIHHLQSEINSLPNKEEFKKMKNQLRILQSAEFNVDAGSDFDINAVEKVLLAKLKRVESDLTHNKMLVKDLQDESTKLNNVIIRKEEIESDLKKLVERLENDLLSKTTENRNSSVIALQAAVDQSGEESRKAFRNYSEKEGDASMIQVLTEQRDRFKVKIMEMESTNEKLEQSIKAYLNELSSLKKDNINLYEKIRYISNYKNEGGGGDIESSPIMETESKYRHQYEASVNPFAEFKSTEKNKQLEKLNTVERCTLKSFKFFLSNKHARLV